MADTPGDQTLILNAAKACYLRLGVAKTTAADIAAEAGISRATLYRRFPSHEDIFISVLERDSMDMVMDGNARLDNITDPAQRIVEGMLFVLDEIPRRPLHAHMLQENSQVMAQAMPAEKLHAISLAMLGDLMGVDKLSTASTQKNPDTARRHIEDLAEWLLRIITSYAMVPSHRARNREEMREFLHAMLDPTINAVLGPFVANESQTVPKKTRPTGRKK